MNKFLTLTEAQRRTVFEQTAAKIKLPVVVIEKDFWVTEILNILFSLPYADKMVFKGGTSLSKVWGIIRRFSEDIDIAIATHRTFATGLLSRPLKASSKNGKTTMILWSQI